MERGRRPVFVMGCHRSGTNLLYDNLLSAGGFAIYRGLLPVYEKLIPRFGDLSHPGNRRRMLEVWLRSEGFRRSGLDAKALSSEMLEKATSGGAFLRLIMDGVAKSQNAQRWAVYNPDSALHLIRIKRDLPEALFIHIIRDGRDIALSLTRMGGFRALPWDRGSRQVLATGLYWKWMVQKAKAAGKIFGDDYVEVHFEELVANPRETLKTLSGFLEHDLDYDRIQAASLGRLRESNSSFVTESTAATPTQPLGRWKQRLSTHEIASLEAAVGDCLLACGYNLSTSPEERSLSLAEQSMQAIYPAYLEAKLYAKMHTPIGRFADLSLLGLQPAAGSSNA